MIKFKLINGEELQSKHPGTFEMPSMHERQALVPGQVVKLIFIATGKVSSPAERMWVKITHRTRDGYLGALANCPCVIDLRFGDIIAFKTEHITDICDGGVVGSATIPANSSVAPAT
jgi:uncharacterized protein YegJ (DUF2314 family)